MEIALIGRARELIASGALPGLVKSRSYGVKSAGAVCVLCSQAIQPGDAEIEVVSVKSSLSALLHPACHVAWLAALSDSA